MTILWITVAMNIGNVLVTALSVYLMDLAGRRLLVLASMCAMIASTAILTVALSMPGHAFTAPLAIISVVCFVASFGFGARPPLRARPRPSCSHRSRAPLVLVAR